MSLLHTAIADLRAFAADESGATAIEYGLIAALVSVACIGSLSLMGEALAGIFHVISAQLTSAATNAG